MIAPRAKTLRVQRFLVGRFLAHYGTKPGAMFSVDGAGELVAQCHILDDEIGTVHEKGRRSGENCGEFERH